MISASLRILQPLYEPESKLLVSPLIIPRVIHDIIPQIPPLRSLDFSTLTLNFARSLGHEELRTSVVQAEENNAEDFGRSVV